MQYTHQPYAGNLARRIEALMDEMRPAAASDPALAFASLLLGLHDLVDDLDAAETLPPIRGGSPFPASLAPDLDGFEWAPDYTGPTPLAVLEAEAPFDADYDAWLDRLDAARDAMDCWAEADQITAHGCC